MSDRLVFFRRIVAEKLSYEKFQHSIGVEVMAAELAKRFGLDVYAARLAGITHDLAKEFSHKEQLKKAEEWNLIHCLEDRENPQVIHGRISAYILENEYGVTDQETLNAVANHTLGRPDMSELEMLIYSADLIEPGRNFAGVDKLRKKLYDDLRVGTFACMEYTLNYLTHMDRTIHPLTFLAYQDLKNKVQHENNN